MAAVVGVTAWAIWRGSELDRQEGEHQRAYMRQCIARHSEGDCLAYLKWGREDLGER